MGQMSEAATIDAAKHTDWRVGRSIGHLHALEEGSKEREDFQKRLDSNYFYNNLYFSDDADIYEDLGTDPKLAVAMACGTIAMINDNYYSSLKENPELVVASYNIGASAIIKAIKDKVIIPTADNSSYTINFDNLEKMDKDAREYLVAGLTYAGKLHTGEKALQENKTNVVNRLDAIRRDINSHSREDFLRQYTGSGLEMSN